MTWDEAEKQSEQRCETVLAAVAGRYGFTPKQLRAGVSSDRQCQRIRAREIAVYLTWRLATNWNLCHLARVFSAQHTEALHIIRKLERRQQTSDAFAGELAGLYLALFTAWENAAGGVDQETRAI